MIKTEKKEELNLSDKDVQGSFDAAFEKYKKLEEGIEYEISRGKDSNEELLKSKAILLQSKASELNYFREHCGRINLNLEQARAMFPEYDLSMFYNRDTFTMIAGSLFLDANPLAQLNLKK